MGGFGVNSTVTHSAACQLQWPARSNTANSYAGRLELDCICLHGTCHWRIHATSHRELLLKSSTKLQSFGSALTWRSGSWVTVPGLWLYGCNTNVFSPSISPQMGETKLHFLHTVHVAVSNNLWILVCAGRCKPYDSPREPINACVYTYPERFQLVPAGTVPHVWKRKMIIFGKTSHKYTAAQVFPKVRRVQVWILYGQETKWTWSFLTTDSMQQGYGRSMKIMNFSVYFFTKVNTYLQKLTYINRTLAVVDPHSKGSSSPSGRSSRIQLTQEFHNSLLWNLHVIPAF